jgi:DNA-binding NarL/FixJ family response regulator
VGATVLIVDDHPTFRRFARKLLEQAGFTVVGEAADCAGALDAAEELAPDAILLDVMLPDGSGVDVAATLVERSASTSVVLTSSRSADDLGAALEGAAGRGFLAKSDFSGAAFSSMVEPRHDAAA